MSEALRHRRIHINMNVPKNALVDTHAVVLMQCAHCPSFALYCLTHRPVTLQLAFKQVCVCVCVCVEVTG